MPARVVPIAVYGRSAGAASVLSDFDSLVLSVAVLVPPAAQPVKSNASSANGKK